MWKWILGFVAVLGLVIAVFVANIQKIILHYPVVLAWVSSAVDPTGPTQEVTWERGPEIAGVPPSERPPNVVVILVDDLGWNDLTWNGGGVADGTVRTPNIDSLAHEGVEFSMGYAGNATCAPSRAALLTGRYPPRFGFESTPAPAAMGKMISSMANANRPVGQPETLFFEDRVSEVPDMNAQGMPPSEITLPEVLREQGYRTLMFGNGTSELRKVSAPRTRASTNSWVSTPADHYLAQKTIQILSTRSRSLTPSTLSSGRSCPSRSARIMGHVLRPPST